ncbi:MAG: hypothetical protein HY401_03760 [Elusimicrobia bacterium]|nr:hypothetical protein [Elusimicrobiota bacterium]
MAALGGQGTQIRYPRSVCYDNFAQKSGIKSFCKHVKEAKHLFLDGSYYSEKNCMKSDHAPMEPMGPVGGELVRIFKYFGYDQKSMTTTFQSKEQRNALAQAVAQLRKDLVKTLNDQKFLAQLSRHASYEEKMSPRRQRLPNANERLFELAAFRNNSVTLCEKISPNAVIKFPERGRSDYFHFPRTECIYSIAYNTSQPQLCSKIVNTGQLLTPQFCKKEIEHVMKLYEEKFDRPKRMSYLDRYLSDENARNQIVSALNQLGYAIAPPKPKPVDDDSFFASYWLHLRFEAEAEEKLRFVQRVERLASFPTGTLYSEFLKYQHIMKPHEKKFRVQREAFRPGYYRKQEEERAEIKFERQEVEFKKFKPFYDSVHTVKAVRKNYLWLDNGVVAKLIDTLPAIPEVQEKFLKESLVGKNIFFEPLDRTDFLAFNMPSIEHGDPVIMQWMRPNDPIVPVKLSPEPVLPHDKTLWSSLLCLKTLSMGKEIQHWLHFNDWLILNGELIGEKGKFYFGTNRAIYEFSMPVPPAGGKTASTGIIQLPDTWPISIIRLVDSKDPWQPQFMANYGALYDAHKITVTKLDSKRGLSIVNKTREAASIKIKSDTLKSLLEFYKSTHPEEMKCQIEESTLNKGRN